MLKFICILLSLCLIMTGMVWWLAPSYISYHADLLQSWLISITGITFLTYGYDKIISGSRLVRVPEQVLVILALVGGTLGAILGISFFRHKTKKLRFQLKLGLVMIIQALLIAVYYY